MLQPIPEKEGEFEIIESYFKGLTTQEGVLLGIETMPLSLIFILRLTKNWLLLQTP